VLLAGLGQSKTLRRRRLDASAGMLRAAFVIEVGLPTLIGSARGQAASGNIPFLPFRPVKDPLQESFPVPLNGLGDPVVLDHFNAYAEQGHGWAIS
jgi:hypothetical protein